MMAIESQTAIGDQMQKRLKVFMEIYERHGCSTPDCGLCFAKKKMDEV